MSRQNPARGSGGHFYMTPEPFQEFGDRLVAVDEVDRDSETRAVAEGD